MNSKIISILEHQRRDALVAFYLGQLVPDQSSAAPESLLTPDDVYEYLLIDNQVSADVDTSRVAQGIASIQQHAHAIFNGMEPGFNEVAGLAQHLENVQLWHEGMSQYSIWAGYQMLADYPENYLDPSLRQGKTESFKQFENEIGQARLTQSNVQKALGNYLTRFEEVSNLSAVCGYIEGSDFRHSDYYFVGRSTVDPTRYFWRKVAIDLDDTSTHVPARAWTEWKTIAVNTAGTVTHVRAVVVEQRFHLVWLEQVRGAVDAQDNPIADKFVYHLKVSYLQLDEQWSPATCLSEYTMESFEELERHQCVLFAALDARSHDKPRFAFGLVPNAGSSKFVELRDPYWGKVALTAAESGSLAILMRHQINQGPGRLQHMIEGQDNEGKVWTLDSVQCTTRHPGPLNNYLELEVRIKSFDDKCYLETVGICNQRWYSPDNPGVVFSGKFDIWKNSPRYDTFLTLNGAARTPVDVTLWAGDSPNVMKFGMDAVAGSVGSNDFTITRKLRTEEAPELVATAEGGNFLDLNSLGLPNLRYVRLNTTFAAELVRKAEHSIDSVLSWEAQHTPEPLEPEQPATSPHSPLDFNGANGRYFWEFFFHLPHLTAWRLQQSFDYAGAEQWLRYVFNPQIRIAPLFPPPERYDWVPYWICRPLVSDDDTSWELAAPRDPDAVSYSAPSHYRKALFMLYLDNLIAWGDSLYRQLTRDALNEAKLLYVRALSLLGPLSKGRSISQWAPKTLLQAVTPPDDNFARFEALELQLSGNDTPRNTSQPPWLRLIDLPWFRLPVNTQLLDFWDKLDLRLSNLRNNLTLDGKPIQLALYESPVNPLDLLRAQLAGSSASVRRLGALAIITPYRFSAMLPRAQNAVNTLIRFGDQVRQHMEAHDRARQESLQQAHVLALSAFVEQLATEAVEQASLVLTSLAASVAKVQAQVDTYTQWLEKDVSDQELSVENKFQYATGLRVLAAASRTAGHALNAAPNTITFAPGPVPVPVPGGWTWSGPFWSAASVADGLWVGLTDSAQALLRSDARMRRRQEWSFLLSQANQELVALGEQVQQQTLLETSAKRQKKRAQKGREQAQELYAFIENRGTNAALYQWLLGQMSTLYFQAYDAVLAMCLGAQACWQYETGDGDTRFIPVNTWVDNQYGLTAGESLSLALIQMETAFLARNTRRLELVKTVSLRVLLKDFEGSGGQSGWAGVIATLLSTGQLSFALKPSLFDRDYPGHYLRQLMGISVSLPSVLGPFEDARMTLTQTSSSYLLKPDISGCKFMYQQAQELADGDDNVSPRFVIANPRVRQQIAISAGIQDSGSHTPSPAEERYRAFEGTGAVSSWSLQLPRHDNARQQAMLNDLQDIIVHVSYMAVDGGAAFSTQVRELLPKVSKTPRGPRARVSGAH